MLIKVRELVGAGSPITLDEVESYRQQGYWRQRTIRSVLTEMARRHPDREAMVGYRSDGTTPRWTYRQYDAAASHAASVLDHLGVQAGDVVAVMLPNWIEYGALVFGINEIGAIYTGIPVAYGELQVLAVLERSHAKVVVIPRRWRGTEHLSLIRSLRERLPSLQTVVVLDTDEDELAAGEVHWQAYESVPTRVFPPRASDEVCYLGFTSGTTGAPKGAMHTHDTLLYSAYQLADHLQPSTFGDPMIHLVASPTGHHTGFIWGVVFTVCRGGTGVHVDRWDPQWGVDIIRREAITTFFGAPTFVQDMMRTDLAGDAACPLRCLVMAGSSVPRSLPLRASAAFGAYVAPAWGMTECSIIVSCTPTAPAEILNTDGSVFAGSQVAVFRDVDQRAEIDEVGELAVKGPALFIGYFERPDATKESFLPGGWFLTGDTAACDDRGWVSLRGRTKDIIIRGGENIPVTDIETLLFDHPDVVNAAVVGVPDERLGERSCAVVVLAGGAHMDLVGLSSYLSGRGLSKHFLPEFLLVLDELPTTQSGKIQKFKLREVVSTQLS